MQQNPRRHGLKLALRAGAVLTLAAAGLVATATPSWATVDVATLSRTHGPSGGGYTVNIVATAGTVWSTANGPINVQFQFGTSCTAASNAPRPSTAAIATNSTTHAVNAGIVEVNVLKSAASGVNLPVTVPASLALPADAVGPATFSVCAYDFTDSTHDELLAGVDGGFKLDAKLTLDPATGASGGGYAIGALADSNVFTAYSSSAHIVQFQAKSTATTPCTATPPGATAPSAAGADPLDPTLMTGGIVPVASTGFTVPSKTKINITAPAALAQVITPLKMLSANYNVCVYKSSVLVAETLTPFNLSGNATLSATSGANTGNETFSITASGAVFSATAANIVQFQTGGSCATSYSASPSGGYAFTANYVRNIGTNKLAVTTPTTWTSSNNGDYKVCVYSSAAGNALLSQAFGTFTIGTVVKADSVTPSTGPAQGGSIITVNGTGFPTTPGDMTATLAGIDLTDIAVDSSGNFFTATVPPHAPGGPYSIVISTAGGSSETKNVFTYSNGITVSPKTAPATGVGPTGLDITGVGFESLVFGTAALPGVGGAYDTNSTKAHVYLAKGVYDPTGTATKANPQVPGADCVDVLVLSDTNLICNLYLGGNLNAPPAAASAPSRTVTGCVSNAVTSPFTTSTLSLAPGGTGCAFTSADVGSKVYVSTAGGAIANDSTSIYAVNPNGTVVLSKAVTSAVSATTSLTVSPQRIVADAAYGTSNANLNSTAQPFNLSDVGKVVVGTGIPAGTTITNVNTTTHTATLSQIPTAASTPSTGSSITLYTPTPIPNGTYTVTIVSNGAVGAQTAAGYTRSIISSGSTFTVADYIH